MMQTPGITGGINSMERIGQRQGQAAQTGRGATSGRSTGAAQRTGMVTQGRIPQGFSPTLGQTMWGTVTGRQGNFFNLQFGQFNLTAETSLPLSVGQRILVSYNGMTQGNQMHMQLLKTEILTKMSMSDLSQTLSNMNLPANDRTMTIAQGLVEYRIPLTARNMADFIRALAVFQNISTTDMAAASFLRLANMQMSPGNISLLSNFIAQHPMLGEQLMELQAQPGGTAKADRDKLNRDHEMIKELKELSGGYVVNPGKQNRQGIKQNLRNLAQEQGIGKIWHGFGGANMEEGWELMKLLREIQELPADNENAAFKELAKNIEENLAAHIILNGGRPDPGTAYYYLQIPLKMDNTDTTVEVRVEYEEQKEKRVVDPENTRIEFDVNTRYLGEIHVDLKVTGGLVSMEIGTDKGGVEDIIKRSFPDLRKDLDKIGYASGKMDTVPIREKGGRPIIERENFETMEKVDVQA